MKIRDLLFVGVDVQEKYPPPSLHQKPSATTGNIAQNFWTSLWTSLVGGHLPNEKMPYDLHNFLNILINKQAETKEQHQNNSNLRIILLR